MKLTHDNYFSPEAMMHYMSTSQFKAFEQCEARALAELKGEYVTEKEVYKEGKFFEACLSGTEENFLLSNPDMVSSRGVTKGEIKSNFQKVVKATEAFKKQSFFMDIIKDCLDQKIVTGVINGIAFKGCIDFFNPVTYNGYDTKCMANFNKVYSPTDFMKINWYFAYGYNYQAAIYQELVRQTFGADNEQHILAVTKEEVPDVAAICFSQEILDNGLDIIKEFAPRYNKIKKGLIEPESCGHCDYCKQAKVLNEFETVEEFE